jgi:hypothetical protein
MKFPEHKCGLQLSHNQHKDYYQTIDQYVAEQPDYFPFRNSEDLARCVSTNEIWELQWYPDTPIGFYRSVAPTLEECLAHALEIEARYLVEYERINNILAGSAHP